MNGHRFNGEIEQSWLFMRSRRLIILTHYLLKTSDAYRLLQSGADLRRFVCSERANERALDSACSKCFWLVIYIRTHLLYSLECDTFAAWQTMMKINRWSEGLIYIKINTLYWQYPLIHPGRRCQLKLLDHFPFQV